MVDGADGKLFEDETEEDIWIGIGFDDDNDDVIDLLFVGGGVLAPQSLSEKMKY